MILAKRVGIFIFAIGMLGFAEIVAHAQQWNGAANPRGTIWRPGNVVVGEEPRRGDDPRPLIEVTRPLAMSKEQDDRLFSANAVFRDDTIPKFEVDTRHAYAGGARSKASILDPTLDFAVHRSAVIGLVNIKEMPRPNDYMLIVGGKILAEEVRIKLIKDNLKYVVPLYERARAKRLRKQLMPEANAEQRQPRRRYLVFDALENFHTWNASLEIARSMLNCSHQHEQD